MPHSLEALRHALFLALLLASAITDMYERRIYNAFTYPAISAGLLLALLAGGHAFLESAGGACLAAALLYPLCRAGGMGLGDLKLLAAVGALEGVETGSAALLASAVVGGMIAIVLAVRRGVFLATLARSFRVPAAIARSFAGRRIRTLNPAHPGDAIPYGVAVAVGSIVAWRWHWPW
ncbi:MAG: prepilin peptidase [Candidatus Coatesbacteria bacterium]